MPSLHHAMARALRSDGQAVDLARESDGEVADVDHFLNFAKALGNDLAGLQSHHRPQRLLRGAQLLAEQPHKFAAARRRHLAPSQKGGPGAGGDGRHFGQGRFGDARDIGAVDRRADRERSGPKRLAAQARTCENLIAGHLTFPCSDGSRAPRSGEMQRGSQNARRGASLFRSARARIQKEDVDARRNLAR